jgi:hypothetical protein
MGKNQRLSGIYIYILGIYRTSALFYRLFIFCYLTLSPHLLNLKLNLSSNFCSLHWLCLSHRQNEIVLVAIFLVKYVGRQDVVKHCPGGVGGVAGGVAQWTSHPHQECEDPGSNPARV